MTIVLDPVLLNSRTWFSRIRKITRTGSVGFEVKYNLFQRQNYTLFDLDEFLKIKYNNLSLRKKKDFFL
jgi:hypothetical protein